MNKELYNTFIEIHSPQLRDEIKNIINKFGDKAEVMKHIMNKTEEKPEFSLSYTYAKKLKNFLNDKDIKQNQEMFELYGGYPLKNYIEKILSSKRNQIHRRKTIKMNTGRENQFIKTHEKSFIKPTSLDSMKPTTKRQKIELTEWTVTNQLISDNIIQTPIIDNKPESEEEIITTDNTVEELKEASICIVLNKDKKILLLLRSNQSDWMPNKYGLVGGKKEDNERPDACIIRETFEETGILLKTLIYCYDKQENDFNVSVFVGYSDTDEVKLSTEHTDSIWIEPKELEYLNIIDDLISDISKALNILYLSKLNKE